MKRLFLLLVLAMPLFSSENLYLKSRYIGSGAEIHLSDVSYLPDGMKDQIVFTQLQRPFILTPEVLKEKLGFSGTILGKETTVIPLNHSLTARELEESFRSELLQNQNLSKEIIIRHLSGPLEVPASGVELKWSSVPGRIHPGKVIVPLEIHFQGKVVHRLKEEFSVSMKREFLVAKTQIMRGERIRPEQIEKKEILVEESVQDDVQGDVTGYTALSDISEGEILRKKMIRYLYAVQKGGELSFVYQNGPVVIKARGRAMESGNVGDHIQILGHSGKRILQVRVVDENMAVLE